MTENTLPIPEAGDAFVKGVRRYDVIAVEGDHVTLRAANGVLLEEPVAKLVANGYALAPRNAGLAVVDAWVRELERIGALTRHGGALSGKFILDRLPRAAALFRDEGGIPGDTRVIFDIGSKGLSYRIEGVATLGPIPKTDEFVDSWKGILADIEAASPAPQSNRRNVSLLDGRELDLAIAKMRP